MDPTAPRLRQYRVLLVLFSIVALVAAGYVLWQGAPADAAPSRAATAAVPPRWFEYDPAIAGLVAAIDEDEISRSARDLQNISSRVYPSDGNRRTADYLYGRLAAIPGLEVAYANEPYRNVIATLPGRGTASGETVIVGAHYDSISDDREQTPGATDNAAGVAIVLELARVMSTRQYNDTIEFAFWNAEEQGRAGSRAYIDEARAQSRAIPLYLNYDSAGYDPDRRYRLDIMYDEETELVAAVLARSNTLYGIGFDLTYNQHACGSDHTPFREGGYPAITTHTERHAPRVHTPQDTIDLVSTDYARRNAQLGLPVLAWTAGLRG